MTEPHPTTRELPVHLEVVASDGVWSAAPVVYTPKHWPDKAAALQARLLCPDGPQCAISAAVIPEDKRKRPEHVVLQGIGIHWIKLPPGTVDDDVNNGFSDCEGELLGTGTLAFVLPFFMTGKHRPRPFDAGGGRKVRLRHHHADGFIIELRDGEAVFADLPGRTCPGNLSFTVSLPQPRPELASRALAVGVHPNPLIPGDIRG